MVLGTGGLSREMAQLLTQIVDVPNFMGFVAERGCSEGEGHYPATIGDGVVVNWNATIGHDARIGRFTVVNPGANISGNVDVGDGVLVGAGDVILQGLRIGDGATVGAGAVVTKDVAAGQTVVGVPARVVESL